MAAPGVMDVIVGLSLLFALALFSAWMLSPRLRGWIERPKYRFQANVRSYDKTMAKEPGLESPQKK